jgi:16S rRNA (cytosine1402-N4)-methyltransferase
LPSRQAVARAARAASDPSGDPRLQALRIAINREAKFAAEALAAAVVSFGPAAGSCPQPLAGGPDRPAFVEAERKGCICPPAVPICVCGRSPRLRVLTKSLTASPAELADNPRARSARLRAAERTAA